MHAPRWRRTSTGCLTCRMRRKKCDEQKPKCAGCCRNRLICDWPAEDTKSNMAALARLSKQKSSALQPTCKAISSLNQTLPGELWQFYKWSPQNPLKSLPGGRRDADAYLLHHYIQVSAIQLAGRVLPENPFLSHLIPMAHENAAVLQCILAISGAHLLATSELYERDTRSHHAVSLRSVKHALLNWRHASTSDLINLLTCTLLLGFFEAVIGDVHGNFHYHLKASRTILHELRVTRGAKFDHCILDLLTEFYAFFAITANISLHASLAPDRIIPQDSFLSSDVLISLNKNTGLYGILFGAAHELLALINPIAHSARNLFLKDDNAQDVDQLSIYEAQIKAWRYHCRIPIQSGSDTVDPYEVAARTYQQAILLFLYTMFQGASPPTPELYVRVEPCIDAVLGTLGTMPQSSSIQTTLLWPVLVTGSCLRDNALRNAVLEGIQSVAYTMLSVKRASEMLKLLWREMDLDAAVYGPWGIEQVMLKYGIDVCCV